ncbi:hypothetical protein Vretimale_11685 [Volvox reticuliferus]|uniref:RING-type E3 ubiquitin transferase n=1 Tax=Volvox reticuliferus TaxID=1737510 RepID=A0A8J4GH21_9CHLO|nr:hypothetical protein Vretifemale_14729 [Volvox reticuliferus]GIM07597.1 hypothetical protein Vretimale_11685 [Volvox reticuliferus]
MSSASQVSTSRRDLSDSLTTVCIAGSITAITLASASYLFYLRYQHGKREQSHDSDLTLCSDLGTESCSGRPASHDRGNPRDATSSALQLHNDDSSADATDVVGGSIIVQHSPGQQPGVHAGRAAAGLRGLLGNILGLWRVCAAPPAAVAAQAGKDVVNQCGLALNTTVATHGAAANLPDELGLEAGFAAEIVPHHDALAPGHPGLPPAPDDFEVGWVAEQQDENGDEEIDDDEAVSGAGAVNWRDLLEEDELEVPDEFKDPISFSVMLDPVVLCATGQVYEYTSLKNWFQTGNRLCPKTNIEVLDVQVVRLPWLKARIHEWLTQHGRPPPPQRDPTECLARLHSSLAGWVHAIRNDTGEKRSTALADLYELLRQWEDSTVEPTEDDQVMAATAAGRPCSGAAYAAAMERLHRYVRGAVIDEAVWLLRHGNPYLQGVAASILAYCDSPGEVSWLAAVAAVPAVSLCMSQNRYTSQAATRLLYNLARGGQVARRVLVGAGAVTALIAVLATDRQEYGYCRDRAAATLALLIRDEDGKSLLLRYGLPHLVAMVRSGLDRWEQRDAATVLLKLELGPEHLHSLDLSPGRLVSYWCCSRAWLEGIVDDPTEGYLPAEKQARQAVQQLQAGTLTHEVLAELIAEQDADLDLTNLDLTSDDPWAENAHASEEAAIAWRLVEVNAQAHLTAAADRTLTERQAAEDRRRRDSVAAGHAAAMAMAVAPGQGGEDEVAAQDDLDLGGDPTDMDSGEEKSVCDGDRGLGEDEQKADVPDQEGEGVAANEDEAHYNEAVAGSMSAAGAQRDVELGGELEEDGSRSAAVIAMAAAAEAGEEEAGQGPGGFGSEP